MRVLRRLLASDSLNFTLSNRLPRVALSRAMGRLSRIENPLLCALALRVWRVFGDIELDDARERNFRSLHACFTRELVDGARPIVADPRMLASPCDGIVGAHGRIEDGMAIQAKGFPYPVAELLADAALAGALAGGSFVTLRITAAMYHHFHAPDTCTVEAVTHVPGDAWNVNPPALQRVRKLYCRNERAVLHCRDHHDGRPFALVAVAAILVAGIRLRFIDASTPLRSGGVRRIACSSRLARGEAAGWFEHGSTIILLVPPGFRLAGTLDTGTRVRVGQALLERLPDR